MGRRARRCRSVLGRSCSAALPFFTNLFVAHGWKLGAEAGGELMQRPCSEFVTWGKPHQIVIVCPIEIRRIYTKIPDVTWINLLLILVIVLGAIQPFGLISLRHSWGGFFP